MSRQLTVKRLISQLRKMPPDAVVVWQDHDHSANEFNNFVREVYDASEAFSEHEQFDESPAVVAMRG